MRADLPRALRLRKPQRDRVARHAARALQQVEREVATDHRGDAEQLSGLGREPRQPPGDHVLHCERDRALPAFGIQQAHELADEEGIAVGALADRVDQRRLGSSAAARDQLCDLVAAQPDQRNALVLGRARELRERLAEERIGRVVRPIGPDQQDLRLADLARDERQQAQRGGVGPVQVVEHDHERRAPRRRAQEGGHPVVEPEARLRSLGPARVAPRRQLLQQLGHQPRNLLGGREPAAALGELGAEPAQHLHPGPVRRRALALVTPPREHARARCARCARELVRGARLADARFAREQHHAAAPAPRTLERRREARERVLAPDEPVARDRGRRRRRFELRHEAVAAPRHRADHALLVTRVADDRARDVHGGGQCAFGDDDAGPHPVEQLALRDHALAVARQIQQEVERLRLDLDARPSASQLTQVLVQLELAETQRQPGLQGAAEE